MAHRPLGRSQQGNADQLPHTELPTSPRFPPKHTQVDLTANFPFDDMRPTAGLSKGEFRVRRIISLTPTQTSGMDAATPEPPGP